MTKAPEQPLEIFGLFIDDCKEIFAERLVSIFLFGSGARGEYQPGKSDINFLVVIQQEALSELKKVVPFLRKWHKYRISTPLFLSTEFLKTSTDSYPLEFLDFKRHHVLVYGEDLLQEIKIKNTDLRLQLERELKGKLLHLRQNFLTCGLKPKPMTRFLSQTVPTFRVLFEGLLYLKSQEIPVRQEQVFENVARLFSLPEDVFPRLLALRSGKEKLNRDQIIELFEKTMELIQRISREIE